VQVYIDAIGSAVPEPIPAYSPDGRMAGYERDSRGEIKLTQFTPQMEQQLRNVATEGHGTVLPPARGRGGHRRRATAALAAASLGGLETQRTVYEELAWVVLFPAFALLVVASGLLPERVRRRAGQGGAA
jgi:hypothetical protein